MLSAWAPCRLGDFQGLGVDAAVDVFEADDVVFAQVATGLHFDQLQRYLAGVGQAVHGGHRQVGGLVLGQQEDLVVTGDLGGPGDHDPVLGTVVVHLQRQLSARLDGDALDLEALAHVDGVVGTPGTEDFLVCLDLVAVLLLEGVDQLLDVLDLVLVGDHDRVLGFHHDHVFQTDQGHQLAVAVHQAVAAVMQDDVALDDVAVVVLGMDVPQRGPGTDIVPAGAHGHHAGAGGLFHHGVVDGIVRADGEGGGVDADVDAVDAAALQRQQAGVVDIGVVLLQLFQETAGAEQEDAAVPAVVAGGHVFGGGDGIGLLDEALDAGYALGQTVVGAGLDVAVTGLGRGGRNAEQHHLATLGGGGGLLQGDLEFGFVLDHVIGGQHQHQVVLAVSDQLHGSDGHGRRGVATEGLHDQRLRLALDGLELLFHQVTVFGVADDDGAIDAALAAQAIDGLLEHGLFAGQGQELLGVKLAREGPESRAATTGQDDGNHGRYSFSVC